MDLVEGRSEEPAYNHPPRTAQELDSRETQGLLGGVKRQNGHTTSGWIHVFGIKVGKEHVPLELPS